MKTIVFTELQRNPTGIFPIPNEGILVKCRDWEDFIIAPIEVKNALQEARLLHQRIVKKDETDTIDSK